MSVTRVPLHPIAKGSLTKLWVGVAGCLLIGGGVAFAGLHGLPVNAAQFLADNADEDGVEVTQSGLQFKTLVPGSGGSPGPTDFVLVNYEGRLTDGEVFDSGERTPMPVAQVVPGFGEALQKMQSGGKYRIWISPELGYGEEDQTDPRTGQVGIPGGSVLIFDVELLEYINEAQLRALQAGQGQLPPGAVPPPGAPPPGQAIPVGPPQGQ